MNHLLRLSSLFLIFLFSLPVSTAEDASSPPVLNVYSVVSGSAHLPCNLSASSPTDGPRLVMCDQVSWEFLTLSMASWNALFSLGLALIWLAAARRA